MVFNVKKSHFFIYLFVLLFGVSLLLVPIFFELPEVIKDIFLSVGCGFIPTSVATFLIDRANEVREKERKKKLRTSFMWGMPDGILWIAKVVIENYYQFDNASNITFNDCFCDAILNMSSRNINSNNIEQYVNERNDLKNKLEYGLGLCLRDSNQIILHEYELQINSIFTKEELLIIEYLFNECTHINDMNVISEMAEYIKIIVEIFYKNFEEVRNKLDRKIVIENYIVKNWFELTK